MHAADVIAYTYEADVHCVACATKRGMAGVEARDSEGNQSGVCFCGAEVDTPQHCADCGTLLEGFALTREGRAYVTEAIEDWIRDGYGDPNVLNAWAREFDIEPGLPA